MALIISRLPTVWQKDDFPYFEANRVMIRNGVQAVLMCNGLFTSHRTKEQVTLRLIVAHKDDIIHEHLRFDGADNESENSD